MKKVLEHMPVGIVTFQGEEHYHLVEVNEVFQKDIGYSQEELVELTKNRNELGWIYEGDIPIIRIAAREAKKQKCSGEYELRIRNKAGDYQWHVLRVMYQQSEKLFVMSVWNIDERKRMEEELYIQWERHRLVDSITGELPFDFDVENDEVLISHKFLSICGREDQIEHFAKRNEWEKLVHPEDLSVVFNALRCASNEEIQDSLEFRLQVNDYQEQEKYMWYRLVYKSILNMEKKVIRIIGRMENINQEKLENIRLTERVKKDALTGVLNKAAIREEAEKIICMEPDKVHALMVIDIDNFKGINDTFGHLFGDTVLIGISESIAKVFDKEELVGRVGGDEFMVFLRNVVHENVVEKATQLCQELNKTYEGKDGQVSISCSVGIAYYEKDGKYYQELFEKADCAMYEAKNSGKNQFRFVTANNSVIGFQKRRGREQQEEQEARGLDQGFLTAAFSLLAHAKDVNGSLNLLLERIGNRYGLGLVSVWEKYDDEIKLVQTNCWKEKSGFVENTICRNQQNEFKCYMCDFDERGICSIDTDQEVPCEMPKDTKKNKRRVTALMNCRFFCQDGKEGMVSFTKIDQPHKWTEFEKQTFLEISRIVSVFVALKRNQMESQNTIRTLQNRDMLTGLYNEKAFLEHAQQKINHMEPFNSYAIVYADIREFSYVNENFGNEAGNKILKEFSQQISNMEHVISCRMHSDLFVSLVWDVDREMIQHEVEERLLDFMKIQSKQYPQGNVRLVAGIYYIQEEGEDIVIAVENANLARKRMKQTNSESICGVYSQEIRCQRETEQRIMREFDETLKSDRLKVYIQPKFLLESRETFGGEALVRWEKEDGTVESPGTFVPILEKSGQIIDLDFYVFQKVLEYMKKWQEEKCNLYRISVNFSRKHFDGQGIYRKVWAMTQEYEIPPEYIEIEVTESLLVSGADMVRKEMEFLRESGFAVAIDDFGTGYSSLSVLQDVPADVVKIDKSFLDRSTTENEKKFIEKIGALIHCVKDDIIFEGIETEEQLQFLLECGFKYGQGYLHDKPIPIDVFEEKYMK